MAVLSDADRRTAWAEWMNTTSRLRLPCAVEKADLRAAFDALDAFFEANVTAINNAIPQPARSGLTTQQKALMLAIILRIRYNVGA